MTQLKYKLIKLGTRTWGGRMEGADESTELWRHPTTELFCASLASFIPDKRERERERERERGESSIKVRSDSSFQQQQQQLRSKEKTGFFLYLTVNTNNKPLLRSECIICSLDQ